MLWLWTVLFAVLVPGTELVLFPLVLVLWDLGPRLDLGPACYAGLVPLLAGLAVILRCFADFIRRGRGTPAIYDPPRELVVAGLYRYVRNPQYVGVVLVIVGEALLTGMADKLVLGEQTYSPGAVPIFLVDLAAQPVRVSRVRGEVKNLVVRFANSVVLGAWVLIQGSSHEQFACRKGFRHGQPQADTL
jgi:Phospholipid methyltransferase